jgi:hypothetical protein
MPQSNKWWALVLVLALAACSSSNATRLRIQIPRRAEVRLADFDGIAMTNFLIQSDDEADAKKVELDFDLNQELIDYLSNELKIELEEDVDIHTLNLEDEALFEDEQFWQNFSKDGKKVLIISGTMQYGQETRKALISKEKRQHETPFPQPERLQTRKFYTLNMHIHILDSESGVNLYNQTFKETRAYSNPNQTAQFAFYDLLYEIKEKLFREMMGGEKIQERYLIIH